MINRNIFRQYDIRGVVERELNDDTVRRIARAFAAMAAKQGLRRVVLGRDNRKSSPHIRDVAVDALIESGCQVVDLGVVVSPMFYFAARHLEIPAGLMITASHNPGYTPDREATSYSSPHPSSRLYKAHHNNAGRISPVPGPPYPARPGRPEHCHLLYSRFPDQARHTGRIG